MSAHKHSRGLRLKVIGWWEEYRCGCVSKTVRTKRELVGYCPTHGDDRRHAFREIITPIYKETK